MRRGRHAVKYGLVNEADSFFLKLEGAERLVFKLLMVLPRGGELFETLGFFGKSSHSVQFVNGELLRSLEQHSQPGLVLLRAWVVLLEFDHVPEDVPRSGLGDLEIGRLV